MCPDCVDKLRRLQPLPGGDEDQVRIHRNARRILELADSRPGDGCYRGRRWWISAGIALECRARGGLESWILKGADGFRALVDRQTARLVLAGLMGSK